MVLPVEARTVLIFALTASRAVNIEMDKEIATARINTTATDRMESLKAFRTPRRGAFINESFLSSKRQLARQENSEDQAR